MMWVPIAALVIAVIALCFVIKYSRETTRLHKEAQDSWREAAASWDRAAELRRRRNL